MPRARPELAELADDSDLSDLADRPDLRAKNLRIHGLIVAVILVAYVLGAAIILAEPRAPLDFTGVVVIFFALVVLGYIVVTSIALAFVDRRRHAAPLIHAIALTLTGGALTIASAADRADAGDAPQILAERAQRESESRGRACLHLGPLRVHRGDDQRLDATLTIASRCPMAVVVEHVDLVGFTPDGGNDILSVDLDSREPRTLGAGESLRVDLRGTLDRDPGPALSRWAWRSNVIVDEPVDAMLCFTTPGAPESRRCQSIDPHEIVVRPR